MKAILISLALVFAGCVNVPADFDYSACPAKPLEYLNPPASLPVEPAIDLTPGIMCDLTEGCSMVSSSPTGDTWDCSGTKLCQYYFGGLGVTSTNMFLICTE